MQVSHVDECSNIGISSKEFVKPENSSKIEIITRDEYHTLRSYDHIFVIISFFSCLCSVILSLLSLFAARDNNSICLSIVTIIQSLFGGVVFLIAREDHLGKITDTWLYYKESVIPKFNIGMITQINQLIFFSMLFIIATVIHICTILLSIGIFPLDSAYICLISGILIIIAELFKHQILSMIRAHVGIFIGRYQLQTFLNNNV